MKRSGFAMSNNNVRSIGHFSLAAAVLAISACSSRPLPRPELPGCGTPAPEQAVIYQHSNRRSPCRTLELGEHRSSSSFAPVANDSVSSQGIDFFDVEGRGCRESRRANCMC